MLLPRTHLDRLAYTMQTYCGFGLLYLALATYDGSPMVHLKTRCKWGKIWQFEHSKSTKRCSVDIAHPHYHLRDNDTPPPNSVIKTLDMHAQEIPVNPL